jgi:hypothetical protein
MRHGGSKSNISSFCMAFLPSVLLDSIGFETGEPEYFLRRERRGGFNPVLSTQETHFIGARYIVLHS